MSGPSGPALPWARQEDTRPASVVAPQVGERPFTSQLQSGKRIEVRWLLTEESGDTVTKWWGAVLQNQPTASPSSVWTIRYDPSESFEPEEAEVWFFSAGHLQNTEDGAVLRWRFEGAETPDIDDSDEEEGDAEDIVELREITAAHEALERESGQNLEHAALQELSEQLTPYQQRVVLDGFRTFADHFSTQLQELVQRNGGEGDYVVTVSDMQQIIQSFRQQR